MNNSGKRRLVFISILLFAPVAIAPAVADTYPFERNAEPRPFLQRTDYGDRAIPDSPSNDDESDGSVNRLRTVSKSLPGGNDPGASNSWASTEFGDSLPGKTYEDGNSQSSGGLPSHWADADDASCSPDSFGEASILRYRRTCYQGMTLATGSILSVSGQSLDIRHAAVSAGFGIPLENTDNVLFVTPNFRTDLIDAPSVIDVPDSLFETGVKFFHIRSFTPTLDGIFSVAPAIRSDFTTGDGAFRVFGIAMLAWNAIPGELKLSAGMVYLDRSDIRALPAAGLLWTPSSVWKIDIQFPQPKISYRTAKNGGISESWVYLAGGFGGNTWAVSRNNGQLDELTLRDLRLMAGFEQLLADNHNWFVEVGWAFNRELEYTTVPLVQEFGDAFLIRGGFTY